MSFNVLDERSVVLRLEFSIADAVRQRGLVSVLAAALLAWWQQRDAIARVPANLREDVGLPPADDESHWTGIDLHTYRLFPPDRRWP